MSVFGDRIRSWIQASGVDADFLTFSSRVHTVAEAVAASGYPVDRFTKSIAMITHDGEPVIALVPADSRASTERVRKALDLADRPRTATEAESEELLGQALGGNCPFNAPRATILVDPRVFEQDWFITGGGDDRSLVRISVSEFRRVVSFTEARVRK